MTFPHADNDLWEGLIRMEYVINADGPPAGRRSPANKTVEADFFEQSADGSLVIFYKSGGQSRDLPVYAMPTGSAVSIEAMPTV